MPSEEHTARTNQYEVEVECLWAGSTVVDAESAEEAVEIVKDMDDSELGFQHMTPGKVVTRGVYSLDE